MSPLGCFLILLVTVINVQQAREACYTPDNFLRYGVGVGDTKIAAADLDGQSYDFPAPSMIYGFSTSGLRMTLTTDGYLLIDPLGTPWSDNFFLLTPRANEDPLVGNVYNRYSTDPSDLSIVNSLACGSFDGVIVVTFACVTKTASSPILSYQVLIATGPTKSVMIAIYETPKVMFTPGFYNFVTRRAYTLDQVDIADDGIIIIDTSDDPRLGDENVLPVQTVGPCLATSQSCSVYANGSVLTLNGSSVVHKLTLRQSYVATVDTTEKKENNKPCKFFLMIRADESYEPIYYVRIGVGVHPKNTKKYLRKFQFSLTNDRFVMEFGNNLQNQVHQVYQADMPYAMDDIGSAEPLGITVDVTDANDGWIIKSTTCGYSFTHLWNNQEPIVTMTLEGERYDGRILGTCGGMYATFDVTVAH